MAIIACGQAQILSDECIECGGWLHAEQRGGFPGPIGMYCSEECAVNAAERIEQDDRSNHLQIRDLLCDCERVCRPAGRPSVEDRAEYQAYVEATHGA